MDFLKLLESIDIQLHNEVNDYHHGQHDGLTYATIKNSENKNIMVGRITWSYYNDVLKIHMIEVAPEFGRQGIATNIVTGKQIGRAHV